MRILNVGSRSFHISGGRVLAPRKNLEVSDDEGVKLAKGYPSEIEILDAPKSESKKSGGGKSQKSKQEPKDEEKSESAGPSEAEQK